MPFAVVCARIIGVIRCWRNDRFDRRAAYETGRNARSQPRRNRRSRSRRQNPRLLPRGRGWRRAAGKSGSGSSAESRTRGMRGVCALPYGAACYWRRFLPEGRRALERGDSLMACRQFAGRHTILRANPAGKSAPAHITVKNYGFLPDRHAPAREIRTKPLASRRQIWYTRSR